jgi:hypothetical protein
MILAQKATTFRNGKFTIISIHFETIVSFVGVVRIWESQAVEELHAPL